MFWKTTEKKIFKTFFLEIAWNNFLKIFFFWEYLHLYPSSLALASNNPVLGLEKVCPRKGCPWPWSRIFLYLGLNLGLEPCVLDSISAKVNNQIFTEWNYMLQIKSLPTKVQILPYISQKNDRLANSPLSL